MKITAIKQQIKSPDRVSIFVDGKYQVSLTFDQLLEQKLKKGIDIDESAIEKLHKISDEGKIKQKALEWLMIRPHSKSEFRDYMYRKKADKDLTEALEIEFSDKKYLNDEYFARWFTEQRLRKNKSTRAITSELYSKGISQEIINEILGVNEKDDKQAIAELVKKISSRPRYQDKQKLISYLAGKGFNYGDIKEVLENY